MLYEQGIFIYSLVKSRIKDQKTSMSGLGDISECWSVF